MTPQERLAAHLRTRPSMPRPVPPFESPAYQKWRADHEAWLKVKGELEKAIEVPKMDFSGRNNPSVVPASDEVYVPRMRGRWKLIV